MKKIFIDFETRSTIDLTKTGIYPYSAHPTTDVNCLGWAIDGGFVEIWEPGDDIPAELLAAIKSGALLYAFNASFERHIWNKVLTRYGFPALYLERFYCVAACARGQGFPGKLEKVAQFADLPFGKDMTGHTLMLKLCKPRRYEDDGTPVWWNNRDEYIRQCEYCRQDVEVERAIYNMLIPFTEQELADYHLSEEINDRGVHIDVELARAAVKGVEEEKIDSNDIIKSMTNGAVKSHTEVAKIMAWVEKEWKPITSLAKSDVYDALAEDDIPPHVADVLEIRVNNAKSAVAKYSAMLHHQMGGLVRGGYLFRGAGQTGRYSSLGVQRHNLLRKARLDTIPVLKRHGIAGLKMMGDPVQLLAEMVRPTFVAPKGEKFIIGDFAQIEARIVAWLADEVQLLDIFRVNGDPYCMFGTKAFGRTITKADELERFISKGCVLGLGFGGAEGALARSMKKENIVLPHEQLTNLVSTYRNTFTRIKALWKVLSSAVLSAMFSTGDMVPVGPIAFLFDGTHLWCRLPSGRLMCYPFAKVVQDEYGDCVEYRRGNRNPKSGVMEWPVVRIWHGLTLENLAQGIAYDLLQGAMRRLADWDIRLHTHDELVVSVDENEAEEREPKFMELMVAGEEWASGLPISAETIIDTRYVKK